MREKQKLPRFLLALLMLLTAALLALWAYVALNARNGRFEINSFNAGYHRLGREILPDEEISSFVAPFSADLEASMSRRLTVSNGVIPLGQPESPLGNLTTDMLRSYLPPQLGREVDIAILNRGGLRIALPEGDILIGTLFELIPFENYIVLLRFTGTQILQIADELAAGGGEPVSGIRMTIAEGRAADVTVGDNAVDPAGTYWVATHNWLADGGGPMPALWQPQERIDTDTLLRDVFIRILDEKEYIEPLTDGRIRMAQ